MNENIIAYALAYLIGAIPFGLILGKVFCRVDIRECGSKSIGATNVLRVLKQIDPKLAKRVAILTFLFDALKGLLPIIIGNLIFTLSVETLWAMAVLAVLGHCFSPYLLFNGGKGVATAAGVLVYFLPLEIVFSLLVWFIVAKVFKISSLASLSALVALLISAFIFHYDMVDINTHAPVLIITFIVLYKHLPNITRLLTNNEKRVV